LNARRRSAAVSGGRYRDKDGEEGGAAASLMVDVAARVPCGDGQDPVMRAWEAVMADRSTDTGSDAGGASLVDSERWRGAMSGVDLDERERRALEEVTVRDVA